MIGWPGSRPGNSHPLGRFHLPPLAQELEEILREHDIAILVPLALLDADHHARTVDIGDLEVDDLRHAKAAAIGDARRCAVFQVRRVGEKQCHLLGAEHHRQSLRRADGREPVAEAERSSVTLKKKRKAETAAFIFAGEALHEARWS